MIRSVVQGCGAYLPDRIVTNDELAKKVDTSDEWIQQRTGIKQRHIAADGAKSRPSILRATQAGSTRCCSRSSVALARALHNVRPRRRAAIERPIILPAALWPAPRPNPSSLPSRL